jgi:hypothetical protein
MPKLSCPIAPLAAVNVAKFNQRALGIRSCENAFHLASTILGGRDIIEEFVAARVWPISSGWSPIELVYYNVNWADQKVPFPKFGIKLREDQSARAFVDEVEKKVNVMVGEYTMNEYKAYKALVKHKKINRIFSEVCGDKFFSSRGPGPKLKLPAVAVASCSTAPINAPRIRSSKRGSSPASEGASSGVKPSKTRSLESSKRKRKTSEHQTSDAELQAASGLAQMSCKRLKKAVKKVPSVGIRRVPSAFDDDAFMETDSLKGVFL